MKKLYFVKARIIKNPDIFYEEVKILKESPKTITIEKSFFTRIIISELGKPKEWLNYGSYYAYCYEEDLEKVIEKLKKSVVQYHEKAFKIAKHNRELLISEGWIIEA